MVFRVEIRLGEGRRVGGSAGSGNGGSGGGGALPAGRPVHNALIAEYEMAGRTAIQREIGYWAITALFLGAGIAALPLAHTLIATARRDGSHSGLVAAAALSGGGVLVVLFLTLILRRQLWVIQVNYRRAREIEALLWLQAHAVINIMDRAITGSTLAATAYERALAGANRATWDQTHGAPPHLPHERLGRWWRIRAHEVLYWIIALVAAGWAATCVYASVLAAQTGGGSGG